MRRDGRSNSIVHVAAEETPTVAVISLYVVD